MIVFLTDLPTDRLLMAYNNNVVRLFSDTITATAVKLDIEIDGNILTLYPDGSNGVFYYNFKNLITSLINYENFTDDLSPDLTTAYLYDWTSQVLLQYPITFTITLSDDTVETETKDALWLSSYVQLEDYKRKYPIALTLDNVTVLAGNPIYANNIAYAKYWAGFPFDMTIYHPANATMEIKNQTNAITATFDDPFLVNRLVFSDGQTDGTIEDVLPLQEGINALKIIYAVSGSDKSYYINLEKITDACEGHYFKWINRRGGWSYYLFNKGNRVRSTKDLGELQNDYFNLEDTISPTVSMGKESFDTITINTDTLTETDFVILEDILESPKVYFFTGMQYAQNFFNDWIEVRKKNGNFKIVSAREKQIEFNISFELPNRVTRTL